MWEDQKLTLFWAYFIVDTTCIKQPSHILNTANLHIHAYLSSPNSGRIGNHCLVWLWDQLLHSVLLQQMQNENRWAQMWVSGRARSWTVRSLENTVTGEWLEYSDWGMVRILFIAKNCCIARLLSQDVWHVSCIHAAMRNLYSEFSKVILMRCQIL